MRSQKNGFTLIELLVVISIISLLASIVLPSLNEARGQGNDARRLSDMKQLETAFTQFYLDHDRYPGTADGVPLTGQQIGVGNEIDDALAPYISSVPQDPTHDGGTGEDPVAGATYYYSYDPWHNTSTPPPGCSTIGAAPVFGFNKAEEMTNLRKDTCSGGNMDLDTADFNVALD